MNSDKPSNTINYKGKRCRIIGAGLAGCEAALQLAKAGYEIDLYEMRPAVQTPAHQTGLFAELVCSNSLKSALPNTASGLLKAEMDLLGCELLRVAHECSVPAGNALAVDRLLFAEKVTLLIRNNKQINFINEEYTDFEETETIVACGPLISDRLTQSLINIIGKEHLYFFDAIAPVITGDSIDFAKVFYQSRYGKELSNPAQPTGDYINCPFDKDEYYAFVEALIDGKKHEAKEFENEFFCDINFRYYENCTPIEELARRGIDTLRFGVMKPVGIVNPLTNRRPYAVIQLRCENKEKTAFNLVGCQTMLRHGEQKRIFSLIPGLEYAEFLRYGSIHRNTYLNTPRICNQDFSLKDAPYIKLAGQISGVEGYVESIFSGLLTAQLMCQKINSLPEETIAGQLWRHLTTYSENFVPMNANFGLLPEIQMNQKNKPLKKQLLYQRSMLALNSIIAYY